MRITVIGQKQFRFEIPHFRYVTSNPVSAFAFYDIFAICIRIATYGGKVIKITARLHSAHTFAPATGHPS
jgi:hypothetical protein